MAAMAVTKRASEEGLQLQMFIAKLEEISSVNIDVHL